MDNRYEYIDEINNDFEDRMHFLKKYYPFFKIYGDGEKTFACEELKEFNIGLVIFALLRFFVEENNFKNKGVTYREIEDYLKQYIAQTYKVYISEEGKKALTSEIYSMLTNDGQPYEFAYYDPKNCKSGTSRLLFIKSEIDAEDGVLKHYITDSGIEFYLETKEIKEFNNISIQQVLLEKMVNSHNFKGARQVVRRISNQVSKLYQMKKEILSIIGFNAEEGDRLYEHFHKDSMDWFEQEEGYFENDLKLVEEARRKSSLNNSEDTLRDINQLNDELKQVSVKYGALLNEYVDLQKKVDDIRKLRKIKVLMSTFDYRAAVEKIAKLDDAELLGILFNPFLEPARNKMFDFTRIDTLLRMRINDEDEIEEVEEINLEDYVFEDEQEAKRIEINHYGFIRCMFTMLEENVDGFTLRDYNTYIEKVFGDKVFYNGDYFSFLIALSAKCKYECSDDNNELSILEETISSYGKEYGTVIPFSIDFIPEDKVELISGFSTTNMRFYKNDGRERE